MSCGVRGVIEANDGMRARLARRRAASILGATAIALLAVGAGSTTVAARSTTANTDSTTAGAANTAGVAGELRFVSCPIYRDTDAGRKSGCWLTDEPASGVRYDVTQAPTKPDWNRAILVEGVVAAQQDGACGGTTLEPVRVSVLDEPCTRHLLPPEGYPGRRFVLPPRNLRPVGEPRPLPPAPLGTASFHVMFDHGRSFVVYQLSDFLVDQAVAYALAAKPKRIVVTGRAATRPAMVSDRTLVEPLELARERAEVVAEWLRRSGVPSAVIEVRAAGDAEPAGVSGADGLVEPSRRRVDVDVIVD